MSRVQPLLEVAIVESHVIGLGGSSGLLWDVVHSQDPPFYLGDQHECFRDLDCVAQTIS